MKAVITAGGRGTRLRPITWTINKHLIPLMNEPMLFNALKKVAAVGIKEVAININPGDTEIEAACGDGSRWGLRLTYIEQKGGAVGVGQIIWNARDFIGNDDVLLYFGDNIVLGSLDRFVNRFHNDDLDCCLAFSQVKDPQRFGVPQFDASGKLSGVVEKPTNPENNFAVTGIYLYKAPAHYTAFENIKPSARGEYEVSDIHDWLIKNNYKVGYEEITGWWKDTGKPEDLLEGNQLLLNEIPIEEAVISPDAKVEEGARIQGRVKIGKGSKVAASVLIRGPVVIGENVTLENCYIGPHTTVGDGAIIKQAEIEHSIIMTKARIETSKRLVDSIIGHNVQVLNDDNQLPRGHKIIVGENSYLEL
jgi:glucose-1-phosphate thymidylyltransferase